VVQLVHTMHYKLEGHGCDSQWCQWNLIKSFGPHHSLEVNSASNRNEYWEYSLGAKGAWCIGLTNLPPSCIFKYGSLNLLEPSGTVQGFLYIFTYCITFKMSPSSTYCIKNVTVHLFHLSTKVHCCFLLDPVHLFLSTTEASQCFHKHQISRGIFLHC